MADNPLLDLSQTVMVERYDLDEQKYSIVSFSESKNACTIKMSDGFIPVSATFPLTFLEFEKIKRMNVEEKAATFLILQPSWDKIPYEIKQLFEDIIDDDVNSSGVPQLRYPLVEEEEEKEIPVVRVRNKISTPKPKLKPKG